MNSRPRARHASCSFQIAMLGKTILLHANDKQRARRLSGHLRAAGNEVVISESASAARDLVAASAVDLAFVDVAAQDPREVVAAAASRTPVVMIATGGDHKAMLDFVCELEVEHFLVRPEDSDEAFDALAREVVVTAEKLLRRDLFGIEKYLPAFGVELSSFEVKNAHERDEVVEYIGDHVAWLGAGSEARRAVAAVVDELVTNAIYDAPRTSDGAPRYASRDRKEKFSLDPWEYVTVRWGSSGEHIAISVSDEFGALRPERVRACLRRCLAADGDQIEHKAGGAGLGMYTALSYCTQLVVNIEHGIRTEVIALIDLRRGQAVRRGGRSLHLFCDDPRSRADATDAVPAKVELSPSILVELREQLAPMRRQPIVVPLVRRRTPAATGTGPSTAQRARGTSVPPIEDTVDANTAIGLLHGVTDAERAVQTALRFFANHYTGAVAYAVGGERLDAVAAAGRVRDWPTLQKLHLLADGPCSIASLARSGRAQAFSPQCTLDHQVAQWTAGVSDAEGLVIPIKVAGDLRFVIYAAGPLPDVSITPTALLHVHRELESSLSRIDVDAPEIEVCWA